MKQEEKKILTLDSFKESTDAKVFIVFEYTGSKESFIVPYQVIGVGRDYITIDESITWKFEPCGQNFLEYVPKKHEIASPNLKDVRRILLFQTEWEAKEHIEQDDLSFWLGITFTYEQAKRKQLNDLRRIYKMLTNKEEENHGNTIIELELA